MHSGLVLVRMNWPSVLTSSPSLCLSQSILDVQCQLVLMSLFIYILQTAEISLTFHGAAAICHFRFCLLPAEVPGRSSQGHEVPNGLQLDPPKIILVHTWFCVWLTRSRCSFGARPKPHGQVYTCGLRRESWSNLPVGFIPQLQKETQMQ